jgi:hypothetical protein
MGLSGQFMSGKMISFAVSGGGGNRGTQGCEVLRLYRECSAAMCTPYLW